MKEEIRNYFKEMLNDGFELDETKENLLEIVEEIAEEYED